MLAAQRKRVGDRYLLYLMTTTFHGFPLCRLRFVENVVPAIYAPPFFQHSTFNHRRRSLLLGSLLLLPPRALVQLEELNFAIYNNECQES